MKKVLIAFTFAFAASIAGVSVAHACDCEKAGGKTCEKDCPNKAECKGQCKHHGGGKGKDAKAPK
jgi:hypothetical protein